MPSKPVYHIEDEELRFVGVKTTNGELIGWETFVDYDDVRHRIYLHRGGVEGMCLLARHNRGPHSKSGPFTFEIVGKATDAD